MGRCFLLLVGALLSACGAATIRESGEQPSPVPPFERLCSDVEELFARYYPAATSRRLEDGIHFDHGTRMFLVHEPRKRGEWQDAFEMLGPNRGGILCDITLQPGTYEGAAEVPQTFDKRYFKILMMAPDAPGHEAHLDVRLSYPADASADFLRQFRRLVDDFGNPSSSN